MGQSPSWEPSSLSVTKRNLAFYRIQGVIIIFTWLCHWFLSRAKWIYCSHLHKQRGAEKIEHGWGARVAVVPALMYSTLFLTLPLLFCKIHFNFLQYGLLNTCFLLCGSTIQLWDSVSCSDKEVLHLMETVLSCLLQVNINYGFS
jgi:hypothetical protein